jgi:hypothetical protein
MADAIGDLIASISQAAGSGGSDSVGGDWASGLPGTGNAGGTGGVLDKLGGISGIIQGPIGQGVTTAARLFQQGNTQQSVANALGMSPEGKQALAKLLLAINVPELQAHYSKDQALADSVSSTNAIVARALQGLPAIQTRSASAGAYNSATTDLLTNDLVAKSGQAGSLNQLQYVNTYSDALSKSLQPLLQALQVDQQGATARGEAAKAQGASNKSNTDGLSSVISTAASIAKIVGFL